MKNLQNHILEPRRDCFGTANNMLICAARQFVSIQACSEIGMKQTIQIGLSLDYYRPENY